MRILIARRHGGFTLIELMVVMVVIAILGAIALPSYRDYVRRSALTEAFTYLSDYRVKMEQYFQDNKSYDATNGGLCATGNPGPTWNNFLPAGAKYFTYSCSVGMSSGATAPDTYVIVATGNANTAAYGHIFTVNESNVQQTTLFKGNAVLKSCWLVRGSEC